MKYGPAIIAAGAGAGFAGAFDGLAGAGISGGTAAGGFGSDAIGMTPFVGGGEAAAGGAGAAGTAAAGGGGATSFADVAASQAAEDAAAGSAITEAGGFSPTAVGSYGAGVGAGTVASAGSALSRIIDGTATSADYLSVLGTAGATGLGMYASNQQSNALQGIADKYLALGAPSRARYEASMTPGFDPTTIPGYSGALDTTSQAILRKLSATGGNPYGNPGALIEANKAIVNGTALPAVQEYQRLNAGTGGIANLTAAAPAATNAAVGSNTNFYNAIGSGISSLTNPQSSLADLFKRYGGLSAT